MAHKKKGHLTTSPEWAVHLRKYMKNQFWKGERKAGKNLIKTELDAIDNEQSDTQESVVLWADFNASSGMGLRLNCKGTIDDLNAQHQTLREGMKLILWDEDFDDLNLQDNLIVKAVARFNEKKNIWEAEFDWDEVKNE